jgi:hypothetical protein
MPNGSNHDWDEEEVEEPKAIDTFAADDCPECGADDDDVKNGLRRDREQPTEGNLSPPENDPQQKWRYNRDADDITD